MKLRAIEVRRVSVPMRRVVGTAAGVHRAREVLYARVGTDEADGWGECAALPGGTPVDPGTDQMWEALTGTAARRLVMAASARGGELPPASQIAALFDQDGVGRLAGATFEMAVLDAELRERGESLASRLGATRTHVPSGAVVGIPEDRRLTRVLEEVEELAAEGYRRVRVKIEPGWDLEPIRAIREAHPDLALQADANGSYRLGSGDDRDACALVVLDSLDLECLEQPLPSQDLPAHAALVTMLRTRVCLDEALTSVSRLHQAIRYGACEVACVKPGRMGGLLAARQAHDLCTQAGVRAFVGGFFETGLGRAANTAVAALEGFTMPGDLSDPTEYLAEDPCAGEERAVRGSRDLVAVPGEPGVGRAPNPEVLHRRTLEVTSVAGGS